jgi:hypothetical protein
VCQVSKQWQLELGFRAQSPKEIFMPALVTREELKDFFKDDQDHGNEDTLHTQRVGKGPTGAEPCRQRCP